jgi:hypothetical protein
LAARPDPEPEPELATAMPASEPATQSATTAEVILCLAADRQSSLIASAHVFCPILRLILLPAAS